VAEWLNSIGVTAFVLKYRLAPRYQHPAPSQDASRAIRLVRARASEWGIDPARVGIIGFSAGGHLASTVGTHFDRGRPDAEDPIERVSSRPDFLILGYPVISFIEPFTHVGSRTNLLGKTPDPELVKSLSTETQVTKETPPTFLMHTSGDTGVPPENSVAFYLALHKAGVPAEMHIYERGRHGLGLAPADPALSSWPQRCEAWLRVRGVLPEGRAN
jgi:acetyl esterase/lipase